MKKISYDLTEQCLNSGISHFDAAPSYGTEKLLGRVLEIIMILLLPQKLVLKRNFQGSKLFKKIILSSKRRS